MKPFRAIAAALALAACATAVEAPREPSFYVMRHLQKAEGSDPGLSAEGQRNAERLAHAFDDDPPSAIYVSTTRRARDTAAPLAARLRLEPKDYDPRDTPGLVARVTIERGTVLVVGHSNTVPEIIEALGGERPAELGEADYGDIWHVSGPRRRTERRRIGD